MPLPLPLPITSLPPPLPLPNSTPHRCLREVAKLKVRQRSARRVEAGGRSVRLLEMSPRVKDSREQSAGGSGGEGG